MFTKISLSTEFKEKGRWTMKVLKNKMFFTACATALLAVSLVNPAFSADTIKIGVGGAHSGELASYGVPTLNAVRLVAEEFNKNGGLLGKQVEVIAADDQCKPELASNAATNLISNEVVGVVGMICSGATMAALPIFNDAEIVVISPSATTPVLTLSGDNPMFFRTIGHDFTQAKISANFIGSKIKPKRIAFLHDNGEYGKGFADSVRENIEKNYKNIKVVLDEAVTPGASDYSAVVRKLRREKADFVVWGGYLPEASKIVNNMYELELDVPLLGPDGLKDPNFIVTAGEASEGSYASGPADTSATPLSKQALKAHQDKYGAAPGAFYDNGYSAAYALLSAIKSANSTDTDKIIEALRTVPVETPVGKITFDKQGDANGISMSIYQVKNGAFVPVFTE